MKEAAIRKAVTFEKPCVTTNKPGTLLGFACLFSMGRQPVTPCKRPAKGSAKFSIPPRKSSVPAFGSAHTSTKRVCWHILLDINPSPPVLIYSQLLQNVQYFDPSGSTLFYMQKRKSISVMNIFFFFFFNVHYGWERVIYTGKSFSVAEKRDEVEPHRHWGLGLSVGGPLCWHSDEYLSFINRVFLNITKHLKLALFIEKYNSLSKKTVNEHIHYRTLEKERERERAREFFIIDTTIIVKSAWTAMFPPPWFPIN